MRTSVSGVTTVSLPRARSGAISSPTTMNVASAPTDRRELGSIFYLGGAESAAVAEAKNTTNTAVEISIGRIEASGTALVLRGLVLRRAGG